MIRGVTIMTNSVLSELSESLLKRCPITGKLPKNGTEFALELLFSLINPPNNTVWPSPATTSVDILRSKHGPLVMEVNSSPGLEGIEKATGIDVAEKIIQFIEKNVKSTSSKTKGVG